jgi:hypothetical protein
MKKLFETWRHYLEEDEDTGRPDMGALFPRMYVAEIAAYPTEDTPKKIALLNIFTQLEGETDEEQIPHILYSLYAMSGKAPELEFKTKEEAMRYYLTPFAFKARPSAPKPTKSLKDFHEFLKVIERPEGQSRTEAIRDFYADSQPPMSGPSPKPRITPGEVDPTGKTHKAKA